MAADPTTTPLPTDLPPNTTTTPTLADWIPLNKLDLNGWRFDVITLLAVIGESSVAVHAQTITASKLCLLPRIIPAPQALLRPIRPQRLPEVTAKMVGVYGGTVLETVGFFANIMHPLEEMRPFEFRVLEIQHRDLREKKGEGEGAVRVGEGGVEGNEWEGGRTSGRVVGGWFGMRRRGGSGGEGDTGEENGLGRSPEGRKVDFQGRDLEAGSNGNGNGNGNENSEGIQEQEEKKPSLQRLGIPRRTLTGMSGKVAAMVKQERYAVPPRNWSPLHLVSLISFVMTLAIFIMAGYWNDGVAMMAIFAMGIASSITCYASWWRPLLMHRPTKMEVPPGDVMIRTREGAFLLIKCREEVARELYTAREECQYVETKYHRVYMGIGMVLLMVAVVLLGNCGWNSQVLVGAAYIILNGVYWLMGLISPKYFWDLSRYEIIDITPNDAKNADKVSEGKHGAPPDEHEGQPSFTRTLWYAIRETQHTAWAERSGAMPMTDQWKKWLVEASQAANENNRNWPAVKRKSEILKEGMMYTGNRYTPTPTIPPGSGGPFPDPAQVAPLDQVKPKLPHE